MPVQHVRSGACIFARTKPIPCAPEHLTLRKVTERELDDLCENSV